MHSQCVHLHPDIHGRGSSFLGLRRHRVTALCRGSPSGVLTGSSFAGNGRHRRGHLSRLRQVHGSGVVCGRCRRIRRFRFCLFLPPTLKFLLPLPITLRRSGLLPRSWRRHWRGRLRWSCRCRGDVRVRQIARRMSLAIRRGSILSRRSVVPSLRLLRSVPWWWDSGFLEETVTNRTVVFKRSAMVSDGSSLAVLPQRIQSGGSGPQRGPEVRCIVVVSPGCQR